MASITTNSRIQGLIKRIGHTWFLLVGIVAFGVPIAILAYLVLTDLDQRIRNTQRYLHGIDIIKPLFEVERTVRSHRSLINAIAAGETSLRRNLDAEAEKVDRALKEFAPIVAKEGTLLGKSDAFNIGRRVKGIYSTWETIEKQVTAGNMAAARSASDRMSSNVAGLLGDLQQKSGLAVEAEPGPHHLQNAVLSYGPALSQVISRMRDTAVASVMRREVTPQARESLQLLLERANLLTSQYTGALGNGIDQDMEVNINVNERIVDVQIALVLAKYYLNTELLKASEIRIDPVGWLDLTAEIPERLNSFGAFAFGFLEKKLRVRLEDLQRLYYVEAGVVAAVALFVLLVLLMLTRASRENSRRREDAEALNRANQDSILRLMNELGAISKGNLKARATVNEEITGSIADSINLTVAELQKVVKAINAASEKVTSTTQQAQSVSSHLNNAANMQSEKIKDATEQISMLNQAANEVSHNAAETTREAEQALKAAEKGASAVGATVKGMNEIREQIQDTSKRIKRLGESSQEIGEIVDVIGELTEQTNVLALNAAIQAAAAGEAGRGFTVVAEEVQRLAERSAEATKRISGIVNTIQSDTKDTVVAMERCTHGVVQGNTLSDAAGRELQDIRTVSAALAQRISGISTAAEVQKDIAKQVQGIMQAILTITQQTTQGTKLTAHSISELAQLTGNLKTSVASFKV